MANESHGGTEQGESLPRRILAIDGGGLKGAMPAAFLAELEQPDAAISRKRLSTARSNEGAKPTMRRHTGTFQRAIWRPGSARAT